mmetsp:Transcript_50482/g.134238  ORF Transcript_50482/g.134238 Transcript_50482/m.134238 type:complete len:103 (+) Transcript_50482:724-1032(+)
MTDMDGMRGVTDMDRECEAKPIAHRDERGGDTPRAVRKVGDEAEVKKNLLVDVFLTVSGRDELHLLLTGLLNVAPSGEERGMCRRKVTCILRQMCSWSLVSA